MNSRDAPFPVTRRTLVPVLLTSLVLVMAGCDPRTVWSTPWKSIH